MCIYCCDLYKKYMKTLLWKVVDVNVGLKQKLIKIIFKIVLSFFTVSRWCATLNDKSSIKENHRISDGYLFENGTSIRLQICQRSRA